MCHLVHIGNMCPFGDVFHRGQIGRRGGRGAGGAPTWAQTCRTRSAGRAGPPSRGGPRRLCATRRDVSSGNPAEAPQTSRSKRSATDPEEPIPGGQPCHVQEPGGRRFGGPPPPCTPATGSIWNVRYIFTKNPSEKRSGRSVLKSKFRDLVPPVLADAFGRIPIADHDAPFPSVI